MLIHAFQTSARSAIALLLIVSMALGLSAQASAAEHGPCRLLPDARQCCPTDAISCQAESTEAHAECDCGDAGHCGTSVHSDPSQDPASSDCCADGCHLCCAPAGRAAFPAGEPAVAGGEMPVASVTHSPAPRTLPSAVHESIFHPPRA
jgi:hypothetical protein